MAKKSRRHRAAPTTIRIEKADVQGAIDALDASEALLELLRGPMNGDTDLGVDQLIVTFQDRVLVEARIRLWQALEPWRGPKSG